MPLAAPSTAAGAVGGNVKKSIVMSSPHTLAVNELFISIQGEGGLIGMPSAFIRLDGCPLRCAWCDTPYALEGTAGHTMSPAEIAAWVGACRHVVITGGEPLVQDLTGLVAALEGKHITVETSGTIFADLPGVSLFSISPKVGSSGYTPKPAVLRKFFATAAGRLQLKFVIADDRDLDEVRALVAALDRSLPPRTPIILQPESGRAGRGPEYLHYLTGLTERVVGDVFWKAYDVRILPQLHYLLWNGVPGR
jgi:7-carboxy-7-deazaguanine synthase